MTTVKQPRRMEAVAEQTDAMRRPPGANSSLTVELLIVFITAAIVFLFLRTSDYLIVDGALRALQVYQLDRAFLHGNNHLLYPVNVYVWSTLLHALGIRPNDPVSFLALAQAMNAVAAAAFLTVFYGLCYKLTNRRAIAALVTLGYGLSRAFLAHATNSAEPMVGLLWSGISILLAVYGVSSTRPWASIAGGLLLTLAMATYQSMVLVGMPVIFLLWQWPGRQSDGVGLRARIFSVTQFAGGFALGIPIVYGIAYYLTGTQTAAGMVYRFLHVTLTQEVYTHVTLVKIVALLPGLAYALVPCLPRECDGFRCLAEGQYRPWIPVAGLAVLVAGLLLTAMLGLAKGVWAILTELEKVVLACCAVGLISTLLPLIYLPTYDKLWLQPLAFLFVSGGNLLNAALRADTRATGTRHLARWSRTLVAAVAVLNLGRAVNLTAGPTPYLKEAQEVSSLVRPKDLLV
jgi:hypothetical protein